MSVVRLQCCNKEIDMICRRMCLFVMLFVMPGFVGTCANAATGDADGKNNHADDSRLPRGKGLAARVGSKLAEHPRVIFSDDFESGEIAKRWQEVRDSGGVLETEKAVGDADLIGNRSLKVTATLGKNTGGGMTTWFKSAETIHIRFYVRFDADCDYVHHFCTLRANKATRGGDAWSGFGGAGVRPQGDERFSTALEPWGNWGRNRPPGKWNFYSYWHQMSASPDGKYWGNAFRPRVQQPIPKDKWICAEFMLRHNTPGKSDGEQAFWIDGELRGHWRGINWRKSPDLWANAFTLESYVTDRWTKNRVNVVYFDNVVIAKEYIGPK